MKLAILVLILVMSCVCENERAYVVVYVGETGAGKSSNVNWLSGKQLAIEGNSYKDETLEVTGWSFHRGDRKFLAVDTPGFFSVIGMTNEAIRSLIQTAVLKNNQDLDVRFVLVVNGGGPRIQVGMLLNQLQAIFGPDTMQSVFISVNRLNWQPSAEQRAAALEYVRTQVAEFGIPGDRVMDVDVKTANEDVLELFMDELEKIPTMKAVEGSAKIQARLEELFQAELANEANWETTVVPNCVTEKKEETKVIHVDEVYHEEVCHKGGRRYGAFGPRRNICERIAKTRQVPQTITEIKEEVICSDHTKRNLRNEQHVYRERAFATLMAELSLIE